MRGAHVRLPHCRLIRVPGALLSYLIGQLMAFNQQKSSKVLSIIPQEATFSLSLMDRRMSRAKRTCRRKSEEYDDGMAVKNYWKLWLLMGLMGQGGDGVGLFLKVFVRAGDVQQKPPSTS